MFRNIAERGRKEIFLDELVDRALRLQFMKGRRDAFLELATDHQDDHFLDVLETFLNLPKLNDGALYVITEEYAFEYKKITDDMRGRLTHRLSNTRYTVLPKIDSEEEGVSDDQISRTGKPAAPNNKQKFSGIGSFDELLGYWTDEYKEQQEKYGSAKPFRALFFNEKSKKTFEKTAQKQGFSSIPKATPYRGIRKLQMYLYSK